MNIYQKLVEVRKNINGFSRDASGYGYKYVSGSQVLSKIKDTMDKQGIILETHLVNPTVSASGKGTLVTSQMKMIWVNAEKPEDKIIVDWFMAGEQKDASQALGSGLTYSERYFLLKFFGVATDEDDPDKIPDKTTSKVEPKSDPDIELKKQLVKKHNGDKAAAKKEYDEIKSGVETEERLDADMENYLRDKLGAEEQ